MKQRTHLLWVIPLILSVALVAADSAVRLRAIQQASDAGFTTMRPLVSDPATPSGFAGNQHRAMAPIRAMDGYHWVMQTQSMLRDGGWRVRHSGYDGVPAGREVHWSSPLRWWTVGIAGAASAVSGTSVTESVGSVFTWANTLLFIVVLISLTVVIARRFGPVAGGVFAVASVTVFPAYDVYAVGNLDHHGLVATCVAMTSLCLAAGGGGWIRADGADAAELKGAQLSLWNWSPSGPQARRWFIASGIAGAAGLWINAVTQVPALIAIGIAAMIGAVIARTHTSSAWTIAPELWRLWGMAGAAASIVFYGLEYFPSLDSMRLEVNHPIYAMAWLAAGDLLCRLYQRALPDARTHDTRWLVIDALVIASVPAVVLLVPATFVLRPGTPLLALHMEYIEEFRSLAWGIRNWTWAQINAGIGLLPVLLLFPSLALARSARIPAAIRSLSLIVSVPAVALTLLALRQTRWLSIASTLWIGALVVMVMVTVRGQTWDAGAVRRLVPGVAVAAVLTIVPLLLFGSRLPPAGAGIILAFMTIGAAAWTSVEVGRALVTKWTDTRLRFAGFLFGMAMFPHPLATFYNWGRHGINFHATQEDVAQMVTRDVSYALRARLGAETGSILGGPTTATWMTYFGGMRSIATLYWENVDGVHTAAQIFGATPDSAQRLVAANGITHIVVFSWDQAAIDYTTLTGGSPASGANSFGRQILAGTFPSWVRPVPYVLPRLPYFNAPWVLILEVSPQQPHDEAIVRRTQFHLANGRMDQGISDLTAVLQSRSDYLPALIQLANARAGAPGNGEFEATMRNIRGVMRDTTTLAFEDEVFLAIAFDLDGDTVQARHALMRALGRADERGVRRLAPEQVSARFVQLVHRFNVAGANQPAVRLAESLLPPGLLPQTQRR